MTLSRLDQQYLISGLWPNGDLYQHTNKLLWSKWWFLVILYTTWCNWYQCHCFRLPNNIILLGASTECCINTGHNLNCNNSNTRMFWTLISSSLQNVQHQNQIAASNQRLSFSILWLILKKANSIIVDYACKWRIIDSLMEWNNPEVVGPIEILFIWILSVAHSIKHKSVQIPEYWAP